MHVVLSPHIVWSEGPRVTKRGAPDPCDTNRYTAGEATRDGPRPRRRRRRRHDIKSSCHDAVEVGAGKTFRTYLLFGSRRGALGKVATMPSLGRRASAIIPGMHRASDGAFVRRARVPGTCPVRDAGKGSA
jgi:hypothetical protein